MRRSRLVALVLFGVALPLAVAGFVLSFGVSLAYLTSHGSAWLSPTAERLRMQWWTGRALTLTALLLFLASFFAGISPPAPPMKERWWVVLAGLGIALVAVDLAFLGIAP